MSSKSKAKPSSIRAFGQRSIASSFRTLPPPNPFHDSEGNVARSKRDSSAHLSLSNFLDRKLQQQSSVVPQTVQGKSKPFLSPLGLRAPTKGEEAAPAPFKHVEEEKCGTSDKVVFEMFKRTDEEKEDHVGPSCAEELENLVADDIQESRKRKNPFEGGNENQTARKKVVVLGGESKIKRRGQTQNDSSNKEPRPLYNHYANGRGWWDYDMEGVDNEELGFSEVWEGVGSTTLGGIVDWH